MNNKSFDEFINGVKGANSKKDAEDFLMKKLTPSQSKKLQDVLSDKSALQQLLSTPQAKDLMKKFTEDKND